MFTCFFNFSRHISRKEHGINCPQTVLLSPTNLLDTFLLTLFATNVPQNVRSGVKTKQFLLLRSQHRFVPDSQNVGAARDRNGKA